MMCSVTDATNSVRSISQSKSDVSDFDHSY
jgi:hypothetical protein